MRCGRGAILHGLTGITGVVEVPENTVVHQVPVRLDDGRTGVVFRVYGVEDNPKTTQGSGGLTWFGRPVQEVLDELGIDALSVWPELPPNERSLWNAVLFPVELLERGWACARWMMGTDAAAFSAVEWRRSTRLSLADSALWADQRRLAEARRARAEGAWRRTAVELAQGGSDIRPLLANPPSLGSLAEAGRELAQSAGRLEALELSGERVHTGGPLTLTEAASLYVQASSFLSSAGVPDEADRAEASAFACVERAVAAGSPAAAGHVEAEWKWSRVTVAAPPRIDLGGGWSDTPPFCLDWGGTVLNIALELRGGYPIQTTVSRISQPLIRCVSEETGETAEFTEAAELLAPSSPGCPFTIPRTALQMTGLFRNGDPLRTVLSRCGGGLEIRSRVRLPIGSGLGTSSILSATVVRALAEMAGRSIADQELSDQVMRLEQLMTTGGGWQDQAGGIFPGAKLLVTGPGLRQRIRVQPVPWSVQRKLEFSERLILYNTGIQRVAKNLLRQVVRSYLAREIATLQVLHSIKTLATEMAWAMQDGEWQYLGELLDRHWALNKVLDPHTTNAPINSILSEIRPYIDGVKLAGAGGGGFLIMLASSPEHARTLRARLGEGVYSFRIAETGLRVEAE